MTPLDKLIDEACGTSGISVQKIRERQARQVQIMTTLHTALEAWYHDPNMVTVTDLRAAWEAVVAMDAEVTGLSTTPSPTTETS